MGLTTTLCERIAAARFEDLPPETGRGDTAGLRFAYGWRDLFARGLEIVQSIGPSE
jgi:hypothetical protein